MIPSFTTRGNSRVHNGQEIYSFIQEGVGQEVGPFSKEGKGFPRRYGLREAQPTQRVQPLSGANLGIVVVILFLLWTSRRNRSSATLTLMAIRDRPRRRYLPALTSLRKLAVNPQPALQLSGEKQTTIVAIWGNRSLETRALTPRVAPM